MSAFVAAACGAIYGLALARCLFEVDPQRFALFDTWYGALALASVVLAAAVVLSTYARRRPSPFPYPPWAAFALALPLFSLLPADIDLVRSITLLAGAAVLYGLLLVAAPARPDAQSDGSSRLTSARVIEWLYPLVLFFTLLLLYLRTLAPAVGQADTFEFQVGVARLGIAHGSGYPLLILIGRLFTLLPVGGTLAFRANLSSTFFAALAAVGVERLARQLNVHPIVAALAGLAFGVSPTLWSRAVEIEVFALNAAFVAAILYLCIDLTRPPSHIAHSPSAPFLPRLMLLAFLLGLSLTNHLTSLFLGPACLLSAWIAFRRQPFSRRFRDSLLVLMCFLVGLSVYLYLPLRWPAVNHGEPLSLAGLANILTGNEARGAFNWRLPFQDPGRYAIVWSKVAGEYGWIGLVLAAVGVLSLLLPPRLTVPGKTGPVTGNAQSWQIFNYQLLLLLALTCLGYIFFGLAFNVPDPSFGSYLIPLHLIAAVLMALGVQGLLAGLEQLIVLRSSSPSDFRPLTSSLQAAFACLLLAAFGLLPLSSLWRVYPLVDHSQDWAAQQSGELMLSQPLASGAAILADSQKIAPLDYLQIAEGRRPDLDIIVLPDESSYRAALDERLAAGQIVYLGRYLPGLGSAYSLRSVGPLSQVSTKPFTSTTLTITPPLAQTVKEGISLAGYAGVHVPAALSATAPGELDVTLVWQARTVPTDNLLVNLRLIDGSGQPAWQNTGSVPVSGLYPTNAWRVGEVISDFYRVPVPPSLPPGAYQLQVALAAPFSPIPDSAWASFAPVTITLASNPIVPPHLLRAQLGANWLMGYDAPESVAPGSHFTVTLYWLRTAESASVTALGESHSLAAWPVGTIVPVVYRMTAPDNGTDIVLAMDAEQAAYCGWLAPRTSSCLLPAVKLAGQAAAEGAVNFDNQILLNHARLQTARVAPGGDVAVELEWQALRAIGADYTVFVHLLGPDGLVHGQVDLWPVSGTRATSGWTPGERIVDPYNVRLAADAPPGAYQVEVGLYLLASGERLPVLNADGVPVDDRVLVNGLEVTPP